MNKNASGLSVPFIQLRKYTRNEEQKSNLEEMIRQLSMQQYYIQESQTHM